jgi:CTP:molybdopterin cytidylyltransferase MocA
MLGCIILASGHSKRFGSDKLLHPFNGYPLCEHCFSAVSRVSFHSAAVVTRSGAVAALADRYGILPVMNPDATDDTAVTIRLGLDIMSTDLDGVMFCVADQPFLKKESIEALKQAFRLDMRRIVRLGWQGRAGNPVLFPSSLFPELRALPPGESGRFVIDRHPGLVLLVEAREERELKDIDRPEDLA